MCRLLVYFGKNIYLNEIIYNPKHSIIKQSYTPAYTPKIKKNILNSDLNLDGFGCVFRSETGEPLFLSTALI